MEESAQCNTSKLASEPDQKIRKGLRQGLPSAHEGFAAASAINGVTDATHDQDGDCNLECQDGYVRYDSIADIAGDQYAYQL